MWGAVATFTLVLTNAASCWALASAIIKQSEAVPFHAASCAAIAVITFRTLLIAK